MYSISPPLARSAAIISSNQSPSGVIDKRYVALVRGWPPVEGRVDHALSRRRDDAEASSPDTLEAQPATTDCARLGTVEIEQGADRFPTARAMRWSRSHRAAAAGTRSGAI